MSEIEASPRPEYTIPVRGGKLRMGRRTLLMGIVNVTPDSFSDGGDFLETEIAVLQGLKLAEEGADIDGYIKRANVGKSNTEEDIAIEEIVERPEIKKPEIVPVAQSKEAG